MMIKQQGQQTQESFVRKHRSFFVGLFVIIPLVAIPGLLFYSLVKSEMFQRSVHLHVFYDQNLGLTKGNPVTISGIRIGTVQKITLVKEGCVDIEFRIDESYRHFVRKDARAVLNQKNFPVGDWGIQLAGGSDSAALVRDNDTLTADYALRIDKITTQILGMVGQVDRIVRQVAEGRGTVGRLLAEDTLLVQVQDILRNVKNISVQSARMMKQADTLLAFLNRAGASGVSVTDSLKTVMATVQKSLGDVKVVMENVKNVSVDFAPMMRQVQSDLDEAEVLMRGLQKNWLVRKMIRPPEDRMMKNEP